MFLLLVAACAHAPRPVDALFPDPVTIVGHRGARDLAPENTMPAFDVARSWDVCFELDVHLAATGEPVVLHDPHLARTTDGTGLVTEHTLAEIQALDAGLHFDEAWRGTRVPTLREVFARYGRDCVIDVEIKSPEIRRTRGALVQAVVDEIDRADLRTHVLVTSFDPLVLREIRKLAPEIARGQLTDTFENAHIGFLVRLVLRNMWLAGSARPDLVAAGNDLVTPRWVRRQHRRGYPVFVWTVDDPARMSELVAMGVDGIITDRPDIAVPLVR